jgi:hypothetical protein
MGAVKASEITIDGDTATLVVPPWPEGDPLKAWWVWQDHPCMTCDGQGFLYMPEDDIKCKACDGTARHCFTVVVEGECMGIADGALRRYDGFAISVHVVEVLPIVDCVGAFADFTDFDPQPAVLFHPNVYGVPPKLLHVGGRLESIPLPPDAAVGGWCVRLAVHT